MTETLPATMTAIEISEPGGPEVLKPALRPVPMPGYGEVLLRVAAAGVNRPDVLQRLGGYPPPPGASDIPGLEIAGTVAAQNLSIAQMFGAGVAPEPEPTIATLLAMGGIVLALAAGLHVHLVAALAGLYQTLPFGQMPGAGDLAEWSTTRVSETFALGLSLALPFIAIAFAYNLALGALSRAMPQLLVSLIGAPLLIGLGLIVLYLSMPEIFARWGAVLGRVLADPLGGLR